MRLILRPCGLCLGRPVHLKPAQMPSWSRLLFPAATRFSVHLTTSSCYVTGTYKEAAQLEYNDSLMPLYRSWEAKDGYEHVSNGHGTAAVTHQLVYTAVNVLVGMVAWFTISITTNSTTGQRTYR